MKRLIWLILFASLLFVFAYSVARAETSVYTVQPGDTLGTIAGQYKITWQKLWELNKDIITNPNAIYVGQKLRVDGEPTPVKVLTKEEFHNRVALLILNVTFTNKVTAEAVQDIAYSLSDVYGRDREMATMLVAIAWQETHFWSRRGKDGEVTIYQMLPATIRRYGGDPNLLEENVHVATVFASFYLTMLKEQHGSWERVLYRWNWNKKYVASVMSRFYKIRKILS